ncbi:hypothetical protein [Phenylobacterium aquaticum]|uniref:hypothetical protein n=1 Tax=Phenylobacterium aquaticum TaxID=1763816 RepID=UPI0026EF4E2A|nr:hypothetical protein [Phenylobacterium aquaticum]
MLIPATISDSRPKAMLRAAGSLAVLLACGFVFMVGGRGGQFIGLGAGAFGLCSVVANLWTAWRPGAVLLTPIGLEVNRPWKQVSLAWKDVATVSVCKSRLAGELVMAPLNGLEWVEVQRREGGPPILVIGSELGAKALTALIADARTEWLAQERTIFSEEPLHATPDRSPSSPV